MDNNNSLQEIVELCLRMDEHAIEIYRDLSQVTEDEDLKIFWDKMSIEESQHVICWKDLLKLVKENVIPQIFPHPETTRQELQENFNKINGLSKQSSTSKSLTENFVLAFRLEFYLLHPALERLWHFYGIIRKEKYNPENEYESHIRKFIVAMRKFGAVTIELEALGETVERMWVHSKSMAKDANFDELTNILNRRGLFNVMISMGYLAKRNEFNSAVLMIDIDHFKRINDTFGHQVGDDVLKEVANIIKTNSRASDILGRFGGEEFIVFLPKVEKESIQPFAEKIRKAIQEETRQGVPVTASIGAISKKIKGIVENEIHELIKQADKYLYEAKRKGRNQVIC
ncbi:MAG: GGDEF domain-containing protein [Desulfobacterales bacterium]|nr:GGDEF domain-containing protein [Desulfobacterales bacterium]